MSAAVQEAEIVCRHCGNTFIGAHAWVWFCSDDCRRNRRAEQQRARVRTFTPEQIIQARKRNAEWMRENRNVRNPQPWLAGPPPFDVHLPGVTMGFALDPVPKWPVALRNTRQLHGAMTAALDIGHRAHSATFALRMTDASPSGWAVHWWAPEGAALANRSVLLKLYDRPTTFHFGNAFRLRTPKISRQGHRKLRIDTITPVSIMSCGRTVTRHTMTAEHLLGSLGGVTWSTWMPSIRYLVTDDKLRLKTISVDSEQTVATDLGGKYGTVHAWEGSMVVDANAPAHWMLKVAALTGLGSRTAFGFGQIRVTEVDG